MRLKLHIDDIDDMRLLRTRVEKQNNDIKYLHQAYGETKTTSFFCSEETGFHGWQQKN